MIVKVADFTREQLALVDGGKQLFRVGLDGADVKAVDIIQVGDKIIRDAVIDNIHAYRARLRAFLAVGEAGDTLFNRVRLAVGGGVLLIGKYLGNVLVCLDRFSVRNRVGQNAARVIENNGFVADYKALGTDGVGNGCLDGVLGRIHVKVGAYQQIGNIHQGENRQRGDQKAFK